MDNVCHIYVDKLKLKIIARKVLKQMKMVILNYTLLRSPRSIIQTDKFDTMVKQFLHSAKTIATKWLNHNTQGLHYLGLFI